MSFALADTFDFRGINAVQLVFAFTLLGQQFLGTVKKFLKLRICLYRLASNVTNHRSIDENFLIVACIRLEAGDLHCRVIVIGRSGVGSVVPDGGLRIRIDRIGHLFRRADTELDMDRTGRPHRASIARWYRSDRPVTQLRRIRCGEK